MFIISSASPWGCLQFHSWRYRACFDKSLKPNTSYLLLCSSWWPEQPFFPSRATRAAIGSPHFLDSYWELPGQLSCLPPQSEPDSHFCLLFIDPFLSIAIFAATPPAVAGIVGAVFSCALLLGSAMISSVATSIQTSVQHSPASFEGRSAAFQFLIAFLVLEIVVVVVFVRKAGGLVVPHEPDSKALEA